MLCMMVCCALLCTHLVSTVSHAQGLRYTCETCLRTCTHDVQHLVYHACICIYTCMHAYGTHIYMYTMRAGAEPV